MLGNLADILAGELESLRAQGLYKQERVLQGPQGPAVVVGGREVLNFCANNYLGLAGDPRVIEAGRRALSDWGYGLSSVRFICGTTELHVRLEAELGDLLGAEAAILYGSCFDANGGLFEPLLGQDATIVTDRLNHASLIDGMRLSRARRLVYDHGDLGQLEEHLRASPEARLRLIVTDGVFSMDGDYARLPEICDLAERHEALVLVDDSHATGFVGEQGRGTAEKFGVLGRVDLVTTTLGKALGGGLGGCAAGPRALIDWLRQRSRPYLFSNSLPPVVCGATLEVLRILREDPRPRLQLDGNQRRLRDGLRGLGFDVEAGSHPIVPVHFRGRPDDASLAQQLAADLLEEGVYCIGFSYPVVPRGEARIRLQASAAHSEPQIDRCLEAFAAVGRRHGII